MKTLPWLLIFQWLVIGAVAAFAFESSMSNHGLLMAIECFCLGALVAGMILTDELRNLARIVEVQHAAIHALSAELMLHLVNSGQIDIGVTLTPGDDQPMRH